MLAAPCDESAVLAQQLCVRCPPRALRRSDCVHSAMRATGRRSWPASSIFDPLRAPGPPGAVRRAPVFSLVRAVLATERCADLAELHLWIAERDIPATLEVEVVAENRGLLADIQYDEPAVRGFDERIDALLARNARVKIARRLEPA